MNELLLNCVGFDRDDGTAEKNWIRHLVSRNEAEQVFFNVPLIIADDLKHLQAENRWYLLGKTDAERLLFIAFTSRKDLIRVISARAMNKKKREVYYGPIKKIPQFRDEAEEREFRATADSTEYINWENSKKSLFLN